MNLLWTRKLKKSMAVGDFGPSEAVLSYGYPAFRNIRAGLTCGSTLNFAARITTCFAAPPGWV